MFDIGFTELMVIAVVALVVLGPERLPRAARFAGLWVRKARGQWNSVKGEFEREMASDELKRTLQDSRDAFQDVGRSVREAGEETRREFESARDEALAGDHVGVPPGEADEVFDDRLPSAKERDEGGHDPFADEFADEDFGGDDPLPDDVVDDIGPDVDAAEARVATLPLAPAAPPPATPAVTPTDTRDDDARA